MEKILYSIFLILIFASVIYSDKCDSKCPTDCEFGVTHEKHGNCKKCICEKNPCDTKKCPPRTVCKPKKDPKCKGESCKYKNLATCVAESKLGVCPSIKPENKTRNCKIDSDCTGANKCCHSICMAPCQTTKCICQGQVVVEYHMNSKGCQVCSCSDENKKNPCELQKHVGPCKASIKKFYYDLEAKACKDFKYGGCGGNDNRFDSREACMKKCEPTEARGITNSTNNKGQVEVDACSMPKEIGECKASVRRFYYDSALKSCQEFIYGGCNGNENNFLNKDLCAEKCEKKDQFKDTKNIPNPDKCSLPMEIGYCRAAIPKFYFDSANSRTCKQFFYGGCGGNENKFDSAEECAKQCIKN